MPESATLSRSWPGMNVIAVPAHTEFIQCYKQALYWMGIIASPHARGPMMPLDVPRKEELRAALTLMGVSMPNQ
jgi:dihydrodipicolinate synthase/N-acetylneuraminate lyase